ncbi:UDP-glycosyltransferase 73C5-like [Olea europaea var. sylvestris]|uniref:UDP-glycosyltransferase 73C5-like n=1 Tax=Olea europaea var. sylvestris TaxID=158386 RepID=UPI000C1D3577|nr:UDP-glycosyltransferase 73C5-like [Olea europaea var. sylvestris]
MASEIQQLHFLLVPLMSQSHIIPLTDVAKLIARRGVTVSLITTPLNAARYKPIIDNAIEENLKIQMISLKFPCHEAGLPEGCENMDTITSPQLVNQFFLACELLQTQLEKWIGELEPKPDCMISSNALPWTQEVAQKFNIPRYIFETISCFTLLCSRKIMKIIQDKTIVSNSESFSIPDIPHKIEFTKSQLPESMGEKSDNYKGLVEKILQVEASAQGILVNSFQNLEPWYVEEYKKTVKKNLWSIGPVSLSNNKPSMNEHPSIAWLDSMKPRSVIYVCFGSLCRISFEQLKEIGSGLEASNFPFIWIIRGQESSAEVEKWLADDKFEERVQGRGLVIRGWAPQVLILSHSSIGGFLTHCGWNSTLEGVCAGVPMITWPMFAEQFYNEKFIVHVLGIGVRIGVEKSGGFVEGDQVKRAIERLMNEGEGEERRKRALKLGETAKEAVEEGGTSYLNISMLIQDVIQFNINN